MTGTRAPPSQRSESQGRKLVRAHVERGDENTVTLTKAQGETLGATFEANLRLSHLAEGDSPARRAGLSDFIDRRLTHIEGMPVHSADEVKAAAKDAAVMALRFEEKRNPSGSRPGHSRTASPATTALLDAATKATLLKTAAGRTKSVTLSHNDIEWTVKVADGSAQKQIDEEVKKFGVEGSYVLRDDFGAEVLPQDIVDGRTYTVVPSVSPFRMVEETPAPPSVAAEAASNSSPSPSPTESKKGRLATMLESLAQGMASEEESEKESTVRVGTPTLPGVPEQEPTEEDMEMSALDMSVTNPMQRAEEKKKEEKKKREEEEEKEREREREEQAAEERRRERLREEEEAEAEEERERERDIAEREEREKEREREHEEERVECEERAKREQKEAQRRAEEEEEAEEEHQRELEKEREEQREVERQRRKDDEARQERERERKRELKEAKEKKERAEEERRQRAEEERKEHEEEEQARKKRVVNNTPYGKTPTPVKNTKKPLHATEPQEALDFSDASAEAEVKPEPRKRRASKSGASEAHHEATSDAELWTDFNEKLLAKGCKVEDIFRCTSDEVLLLCEVQLRFSPSEAARIERQWRRAKTHAQSHQPPAPTSFASPSSLSVHHNVMEGRRDSLSPGTDLFTQVESVVMSSITCSPDIAVQVTRIRQLIPGARICGQYKAAKDSLRAENRQKKVLYFAGPSMPPLTEVTSDALFGEASRTGCLVFSTEAHIVGGPSASSTATKKLLLCEVVMGCVARPASRRAASKVGPLPDCTRLRKMLLQEQDKAVQHGVPPPDTLAIDYPYVTEGADEGQVATQYVTGDAARVLPRYVVYLKVKKHRPGGGRSSSRRDRTVSEYSEQSGGREGNRTHAQIPSNRQLTNALTLKATLEEEEKMAAEVAEANKHMIESEFDRLQRELLAKKNALIASATEMRSSAHSARCHNAQLLETYISDIKYLNEAGEDTSHIAPLPGLADSSFGFSLKTSGVKSAINQMQLQQ